MWATWANWAQLFQVKQRRHRLTNRYINFSKFTFLGMTFECHFSAKRICFFYCFFSASSYHCHHTVLLHFAIAISAILITVLQQLYNNSSMQLSIHKQLPGHSIDAPSNNVNLCCNHTIHADKTGRKCIVLLSMHVAPAYQLQSQR